MSLAAHSISTCAELLASDPNCSRLAPAVLYSTDSKRVSGLQMPPMQSYDHSLVAESACILAQLGQVAQAAAHIFADIQARTGDISARLDKTQTRVMRSFEESNNVYRRFRDTAQ